MFDTATLVLGGMGLVAAIVVIGSIYFSDSPPAPHYKTKEIDK